MVLNRSIFHQLTHFVKKIPQLLQQPTDYCIVQHYTGEWAVGEVLSPAILLAIDTINEDPELLPGTKKVHPKK